MDEYRGNVFLEIAKAINDGKKQFLLTSAQMRQLVEAHNAVVEGKNEVVRELHHQQTATDSPCPSPA